MKILKQTSRRSAAGFSLAEMMVVIVIIGLLVGVVAPNVMQKLFQANETVAKADINTIEQAITQFAMNNGGSFPDSLEQLLDDGNGESYFKTKSIPKDPWSMEYMYDPPSSPGEDDYRIYTYGADKVAGGEGKNKDIDQNFGEEE
jgi:general secretion pathway protein G